MEWYHPSCVGSQCLEFGLAVLGSGDSPQSRVGNGIQFRNVLGPLSLFVDILFDVSPRAVNGIEIWAVGGSVRSFNFMLEVVEALLHSVGAADGSIVPNQQPTAW